MRQKQSYYHNEGKLPIPIYKNTVFTDVLK